MPLGTLNKNNFDEALEDLRKMADAKKRLVALGVEPQVWIKTQELTHEQVQLLYHLMKVD
ncbi:hypothetical protein P7366_03455 [Vibrio parahaemolyticus]|nr:hypothetical protein [Vibrio parahaemolyticus]